MNSVKVFGFGSYFNGESKYNDIDIFLLHADGSVNSCRFAIKCKENIGDALSKAHITILSRSEEVEKNFLQESKAQYIGIIDESNFKINLEAIVKKVVSHRSKH